VDVEADHGVEHALRRHMHRHVGRQHGQDVGQPLDALFREQHRIQPMPPGRRKGAQHHFTLDDEPPAPADQVAFAQIAVGLDPQVVGIGDRDGHQAFGARAVFRNASNSARAASAAGRSKAKRTWPPAPLCEKGSVTMTSGASRSKAWVAPG
jgi:hypothetical protein